MKFLSAELLLKTGFNIQTLIGFSNTEQNKIQSYKITASESFIPIREFRGFLFYSLSQIIEKKITKTSFRYT